MRWIGEPRQGLRGVFSVACRETYPVLIYFGEGWSRRRGYVTGSLLRAEREKGEDDALYEEME